MARYTSQLIVLETPELVGELKAYAACSDFKISDMLREIINSGWPDVKARIESLHGPVTAEAIEQCRQAERSKRDGAA